MSILKRRYHTDYSCPVCRVWVDCQEWSRKHACCTACLVRSLDVAKCRCGSDTLPSLSYEYTWQIACDDCLDEDSIVGGCNPQGLERPEEAIANWNELQEEYIHE